MNKKLLELVQKKCTESGLDYDQAIASIETATTNLGLTEQNAILLWMSENSNALKRTKMDIIAYILHFNEQGRSSNKNGKELVAHDLILLASYGKGSEATTGILTATLWEGGDRGDSPILPEIKGMDKTKVYSMSKVGVDLGAKRAFLDDKGAITPSTKTLKDLIAGCNIPFVSSALDFLDTPLLWKGTIIRGVIGQDSIGIEFGHIPEDCLDIPSPVMVWFPSDPDVTPDGLKEMEGKEAIAAARFYLKKDGTLGGSGYSLVT